MHACMLCAVVPPAHRVPKPLTSQVGERHHLRRQLQQRHAEHV